MTANIKRFAVIFLAGIMCVSTVQAQTLKHDALFNLNWKFIQGNPAGSPQSTTFNDAAWATVSVPHSASYDAPTVAAELKFYGNPTNTGMTHYWYRKKFLCPASAQKVFIRFEGVMQGDTVYVNGTKVGMHYNSGYTGFFFDISNYVSKGDTTLIALHCTISNDNNIPPGGGNWTSNGNASPDYLLYSGIYRDVHLIFKDSVYIPVRGERITTTGSTGSPTVHAVTYIRNDAVAAKSVTVALTLRNMSGTSVATATSTQSVAANSTFSFDLTTGAIATPSLWSPTSPYLYSLQTLVSVGGAVVDSSRTKIGLRFFSWSANTPGGLSLNGTLTKLRGVCLAQFMGWIENAVPDSRFAKQVAMIKDMGINSIRCSHYPRADAFYNACDSVGMLVLAEVPSWGVGGGFSGLTLFWNRMYSCDTEMVLDGYNHPSIWGWSCFNEPIDNLGPNFSAESTIIHRLDPVSGSGRVTLVANAQYYYNNPLDIFGLNYDITTTTSLPIVNTEDYKNWNRLFLRGNSMDSSVSSSSEAAAEVNTMVADWSTTMKCGGAHFWCFQDYCSYHNEDGLEGIVDRLWMPKNVYFMFKNKLTGAATDYWQGGTPTQLLLAADLTSLQASGSDISQIVATMRNAAGQCVQTPCNITFTVTGPATLFPDTCLIGGTLTGNVTTATTKMRGGRCGALLRTTTTPGTITVVATSSCGLASASVTLTSTPDTESYYLNNATSVKQGLLRQTQDKSLRLHVVYSDKGVMLSFPAGVEKSVQIINVQGKTIASYTLRNATPILVSRRVADRGFCFAAWSDNGRRMLTRLNFVQ
ncbi:MAG: sugar-binding domain-containing protein [Chitinispirillaceae bacterium]|jgi:beta-galactosidase